MRKERNTQREITEERAHIDEQIERKRELYHARLCAAIIVVLVVSMRERTVS
jgi:hypothetical protein